MSNTIIASDTSLSNVVSNNSLWVDNTNKRLLTFRDSTGTDYNTNGLTSKGDILSFSTTPVNLAVGTNGQVLTADSTQATGLKWALPYPLTTKGDLFTYSTTAASLAVGTNGQILTADSTQATGIKWADPASSIATPAYFEPTSQVSQLRWNREPLLITLGLPPYYSCYDSVTNTIWVTTDNTTVYKLNVITGAVLSTFTGFSNCRGIVTDGTYIWVASNNTAFMKRIEIATGTITGPYAAGTGMNQIVYDWVNGKIWISETGDLGVFTTSTQAFTTVATGGGAATGAVFDGTYVYTIVVSSPNFSIKKVTASSSAISTILTTGMLASAGIQGLVYDSVNLWVSGWNGASGNVWKISTTGTILAIYDTTPYGGGCYPGCFDGTHVWIPVNTGAKFLKINATTGDVIDTFTTASGPTSAVFDGSNIWFAATNFYRSPVSWKRNAGGNTLLKATYENTSTITMSLPTTTGTTTGTTMVFNASGQFGPQTSSLRFKTDIVPMDPEMSSAIYNLTPKMYKYIVDPTTPHIGLIAEEVDLLFPDLVPKDQEGLPFSVSYDRITVLLLNEMKKMKVALNNAGINY
jgi:hypothetical protein